MTISPVVDFGSDMELRFRALPHWRGLAPVPEPITALPFSLGWDRRGFICQTSPPDVRGDVIAHYADDRYHHITAPPGASKWANALGGAAIDFLRRTTDFSRGARVLEIGAGSVYTAQALVQSGEVAEYVIMDPAIREVSPDPRISVQRTYFDADCAPAGHFDAVIAVNCLEHVEDPVKFLDAARRALRDGGRIVLVFPDVARQLRRGDLNVVLHEHLNYFSFESASALFVRLGFRIVARETRSDRQFFTLAPDRISPHSFDIPVDESFMTAAQRFKRSLERSSALLHRELATGRPVAVHGATNGLNNTLFLAGLAGVSQLVVFDGDESKTGWYLPTVAGPIRHVSDPSYKQMTAIYVAAVTFFDEIRDDLVRRGLDRRAIEPLVSLESDGAIHV